MKLPLKQFLSEISRAFVISAREATIESISIARRAHEDLAIEAPIGGTAIKVEGAANLPSEIIMLERAKIATEGFLSMNSEGELDVTLRRGMFATLPKIEVEIELNRTQPLESMEILRDRALDGLRDQAKAHAAKTQVEITEGDKTNGTTN